MAVNLDFFDDFHDPYLQTAQGKGVFLSGVLLGYIAYLEAGDSDIKNTPLFKQLQFGRMTYQALQRSLSQVPRLIAGYERVGERQQPIRMLLAEAGRMLLAAPEEDMGVEGNFAFTVGFVNSGFYISRIFPSSNEKGEGK